MGCCSVTQRHTGVDEVGPDEIELLELSGDNLGVWNLSETRLQVSVRRSRDEQRPPLPPPPPPPPRRPSVRPLEKEAELWGRSKEELHQRIYSQKPLRAWEGQAAHKYGEIIHSSLVLLYNSHTQGSHEHFLVLFSFHLLILSLDHSQQDFIYEGILPLSGLSFRTVSLDRKVSHSPHAFETSSPMMDSKVFICASAAELQQWLQHLEDRRYKSMTRSMSPSQCALSYLLPCDEHWKREELKAYLMHAPIWQWEGSPIQHMGQPGYTSMVHIIDTQKQESEAREPCPQSTDVELGAPEPDLFQERDLFLAETLKALLLQGLQERLMLLFPHDVLLLSVDSKRLNIRYEGRLARQSIKAVERSALPGRMEFELIGELVEPLLISCAHQEDYWNWIFQLQQPDRNSHTAVSHAAPPIVPKLQRSRKESQEPTIRADRCDLNGRC